jgi:hypothetical protein
MAAYITLEYLESFATEREIDLYEYDPALVRASLVAAADFLNAYYKFVTPLSAYSVIPEPIQQANALAAILHLQGLLFVDPSANLGGVVVSEEKEMKGFKKKVTYEKGTAITEKMRTPVIDGLLRPYVIDENGIQVFSVGRRG